MNQIALRIPGEVATRAEALVKHLRKDPSISALGRRVTRSDVLRTAIQRGLAAMEEEFSARRKRPRKK